jgi:hypothetical protein
MTIVSNSTTAFQRHEKDMKSFRRAHTDIPNAEPRKPYLISPVMLDTASLFRTRLKTCFTDARGKLILIPIWQLTLPKGSEN